MPISLQKGQKVDLTKGNPSLRHVLVGLGWTSINMMAASTLTLMPVLFCSVREWTDSGYRCLCILWESQTFVRLCGAHGR